MSLPGQITGSMGSAVMMPMDTTGSPSADSTGASSGISPKTGSRIPSMAGMEGQAMSASKMAVFWPCLISALASSTATALLPTPPLPEVITITFFAGFFTLLEHSAWQVEQSCSHA